ncbi:MAG: FMN-binding negative transcriptional regulator [Pseudoclavibacter sp.]
MHEFEKYRAPSGPDLVELVRRNPFALVVSAAPGRAPVATHTPVIVPADEAPTDTLVGTTLLGHVARRNPQWRDLSSAGPVLLVFTGPHGYVSPTSYGYTPSVPTWDYAAVHLTATVEVLEARDDCLRIVRETVRAAEELMPTPWDDTDSVPTFERIVDGVVGFRLHVTEERAVFKVSQDMPADVRERVARDARERGDAHGDLAALVESEGRLVCPFEDAVQIGIEDGGRS